MPPCPYVPVITIDGTSSSGKGTLALALARRLGWHYLDSGALYRILAWASTYYEMPLDHTQATIDFIDHLNIRFVDSKTQGFAIFCDQMPVTQAIRQPKCSILASEISKKPEVRKALLNRQLHFRAPPGLVTDGRDMGTVVFSDAPLKLFLKAGLEERARRRYQQLKRHKNGVSLPKLQKQLAQRDKRDQQRDISPLLPAHDAISIDTSMMTIKEVFNHALMLVQQHLKLAS